MMMFAIALLLQRLPPQDTPMTDEALIAYASTPFDPQVAPSRGLFVIGKHNGVTVVADYSCSDLCPEYTTRVIHYDVAPGYACDRIGAVTSLIYLPYVITMRQEPFCVPKVLAHQLGHPIAAQQYFLALRRDQKLVLELRKSPSQGFVIGGFSHGMRG